MTGTKREADLPQVALFKAMRVITEEGAGLALPAAVANLLADQMTVVATGSTEFRTLPDWMAQLVDTRSSLASGHGSVGLFSELPVPPPASAGPNPIYEVGNDPDTNKLGSYRWTGSAWVKMIDRTAVLQSSVDQANRILLEAIVFNGKWRLDWNNLYGGGANSVYLPRAIFIKRGTQPPANLLIGPESPSLPGFVRLDLSVSDRTYVYLDLNDNTYKTVLAAAGDMTLPPLDTTRIIPLAVFWLGGAWCPFEILDVDPQHVGALLPARPFAWSKAELKIRFPSMRFLRRGVAAVQHDPPNGELWEEVAGTASTSNPITYWFDPLTNTIKASAAGLAPYSPQGDAVYLGRSVGGTFVSPYPVAGGAIGSGRGINRCGWGKRPILAPFKLFPALAQEADITEPALTALGFAKGMRNVQGSPGSPFVSAGDVIPDGRFPQRFIGRMTVQSSVDNYFGDLQQARFQKDTAAAFLAFNMTLEKKLSARAARFLITFDVPDPATSLVDQGSPWTQFHLGVTNNNASADIVITGLQWDFAATLGSEPSWMELNDFPPIRDLNARVKDLEVASADPAVDVLYGPDMWLIDDPARPIQLYPDNINATAPRSRRKGFKTGLVSLKTLPNGEVLSYAPESDGAAILIDPKRMGSSCYIWADRYSEGLSAANARHTREGINVHISPATVAATTIGLFIGGDSLSAPSEIKLGLKGILASMGVTVNFIGSRQASLSLGNEARGGNSWGSWINAFTLSTSPAGLSNPLPVGQEAAYLLLPDDPPAGGGDSKALWNPCVRLAVGGDDPAKVFNGYIFDFPWYRNRWAGTSLGILPVPSHALINMGTGDINLFAPPDHVTWVMKGLQTVIPSMLADGVQHIGLVFPTFPNSTRDPVWGEQGDVAKAIMSFKASLSAGDSAKVDIVSAWAHMSQDMGWIMTGDPDPITGAATKTITDQTHYYNDLTRSQINKQHAAWIGCKIAGT